MCLQATIHPVIATGERIATTITITIIIHIKLLKEPLHLVHHQIHNLHLQEVAVVVLRLGLSEDKNYIKFLKRG